MGSDWGFSSFRSRPHVFTSPLWWWQSGLSSDCLFSVKMKTSTLNATFDKLFLYKTSSAPHFLLCWCLIRSSPAYFQPLLPPPAAHPPILTPQSPRAASIEWRRCRTGVCAENRACPLWQTVHTCLIGAGVCCACRAKGLSTTIRTLTGLALF